ncbi:hypothetical protein A3Q56_07051, partial [Intoshia linei]
MKHTEISKLSGANLKRQRAINIDAKTLVCNGTTMKTKGLHTSLKRQCNEVLSDTATPNEENKPMNIAEVNPIDSSNLMSPNEPSKLKLVKEARKKSSVSYEESKKTSDSEPPKNDDDGHIIFSSGDVLTSKYSIKSILGSGTFGKVILADYLDNKSNYKQVAVKIVRNVRKYYNSACIEIQILEKIGRFDPNDESGCIEMLDYFDFHGHMCIVFPVLGPSVFQFMLANEYIPYSMKVIRHISYQLCLAIEFLHKHRLTHTDLKPENILFVNGDFDINVNRSGQTVKIIRKSHIRIIDFGSATFNDEHHSTIVSTRHYRAPEVILELGWEEPCDVWSVGCIMFELYTGHTLFQTHDNLEHLAIMERVLGTIPRWMSRKSVKAKYFRKGRLDWDPTTKDGRYVRSTTKHILKYCSSDTRHYELFDLIEAMLEYDPKRRITMSESLKHNFFDDLPDKLKIIKPLK